MSQFAYVQPIQTAVQNICPVGDSITAGSDGIGGYRTPLANLLNATRRTAFIGTQNTGGPPGTHKGYPGASIALFAPGASTIVPTNWTDQFAAFGTPKLCLCYVGVNGLQASLYTADITAPILAGDANVKLLCAPLFPSQGLDTASFNSTMIAAVQALGTYGTRVFLAQSMASALTLSDLADGLHPTTAGYAKMATAWYNEITAQGLLA